MTEKKYPNNLEKILATAFIVGMLATGISAVVDAYKQKLSARTYNAFALTLVSGIGAFRREKNVY